MSKGGDPGDLRRSVRRGEFQVTRPQDWVFEGNIRHRVCRSTLPTPSGWADRAVAVCEHSGQKPDVWMQLITSCTVRRLETVVDTAAVLAGKSTDADETPGSSFRHRWILLAHPFWQVMPVTEKCIVVLLLPNVSANITRLAIVVKTWYVKVWH